ncbi:MAG: glycosyltransferase family 2 protein [Acidobacteriota bacterium]
MVSVIIPTYNRASFLKEAVISVMKQSVFNQLYKERQIECWIIDDGSTDNTKETIYEFGSILNYVYQPHQGVSVARNKGLSLVKGEYVAFLDSDDLWLEDKLRIQLNFMNHFSEAAMCYTEEVWVRHGVVVNPQKKHRKYSGWVFDKVLPLCLLSLSSAVFRKQAFDELGGFDESLPACEDYDFGIRLAQRYPYHLISKPLIVKRGGHPDQLSRKYWGLDRFRVVALKKTLALDLTPRQERSVRQEIIQKSRVLHQGFQKRGKIEEAEYYRQLINKYQIERRIE